MNKPTSLGGGGPFHYRHLPDGPQLMLDSSGEPVSIRVLHVSKASGQIRRTLAKGGRLNCGGSEFFASWFLQQLLV